MKKMILIVTLALLTSCSLIETASQNPALVNIATNQVVLRYINNADTQEAQIERAQDFSERATRVLEFIDGNPEIETIGVMWFIDSSIDWDGLQPEDKLLISEILSLVESELRKHELEGPQLTEGTKIALRTLLNVALRAAQVYL